MANKKETVKEVKDQSEEVGFSHAQLIVRKIMGSTMKCGNNTRLDNGYYEIKGGGTIRVAGTDAFVQFADSTVKYVGALLRLEVRQKEL